MASPGYPMFGSSIALPNAAPPPSMFTPAGGGTSGWSPSGAAPGVVPQQPNSGAGSSALGAPGAIKYGGTGVTGISTLYPGFTSDFYKWMQGQIGQGAPAFGLSAQLPSSGQATTPGSLTAPLTDTLKQLQSFYNTGTGGPTGSGTLAQASTTGLPTDVGPAWQSMVAAQQQNIAQNLAQLQEQFSKFGTLKGSPFGTATSQYEQQTTLDQNALLAQMQQQASEAAAGRRVGAATTLNQQAQNLGQMLQGLDQASITNLLNEFIRTSPQYSPLLGQMGQLATTFPPTVQTGSSSLLSGVLGTAAGLIPYVGSGLSKLFGSKMGTGAGTAGGDPAAVGG